MLKRVRAYIGLGANIGDVRANLEHAVRALDALPGVRLQAVSPLYRTSPVGVIDQPAFLNAVAALDVPAGPTVETGSLALLDALKGLEQAIGRQPRQRWGPREIDLDLLVFGRHHVSVRRPGGGWLEVPHPLMGERLFVLAPLADLAPRLLPPGWRETVGRVATRLADTEGGAAVRLGDWYPPDGRWA